MANIVWVVTETRRTYPNGNIVLSLHMTQTVDVDPVQYPIDTYANDIKGKFLYMMKTIPAGGADAPAGTFDVDLEDEDDSHILDTDANANNAVAFHEGSATLGRDPMIMDELNLVVASLGVGNIVTIKLYFSDHPQVT